MKMPSVLITGINGQDGSYLAEKLIKKGYHVHGIIRQEAFEAGGSRTDNIQHLMDDIQLHIGSVNNHLFVHKVIADIKPDECYHLAASSFVDQNFNDEMNIWSINFQATHFLLASIKELAPLCKFYFAGSSEMFGDTVESPQNEQSVFKPRTLYGISKLAAYHLVNNYRAQYNLFASTGILYNHESPRRGYQFVTRKITRQVAKIHLGLEDHIELGNLDGCRDWGYAPEYVEAMWLMLQQSEANDYVIATGQTHTVAQLLDCAFSAVNLNYKEYLKINPNLYRREPQNILKGDSSKAFKRLKWTPKKTFEAMIHEMVASDIKALSKVPA
jgi:GDPmannose 4,6-dehydratase